MYQSLIRSFGLFVGIDKSIKCVTVHEIGASFWNDQRIDSQVVHSKRLLVR